MRAVFWKELYELLLGTLATLAFAVVFGLTMGRCVHREIVVMLTTMLGVQACVFGAWQAFLDRRAAGDQFLMHRPISTVRIHVARGFAGLASLAATIAATFGVMCYVAYRAGFDEHGVPLPEWELRPWWDDLTTGRAAFAFLFAASCWALVRLGGTAARPLIALFLAPTLPFLFLLMVGRTPEIWPPVVVAAAVGVGAVLLGTANAACRRATRRS